LDVGCGEGRNSIFLAEKGFIVDAFDLSEAGIEKAKRIAEAKEVSVNFFICNLGEYIFEYDFDVILSHGVLHLCEKEVRNRCIESAKTHTKPGGVNAIGIFTNRLPAAPDMEAVTKSLFDVGELPAIYADWDIIHHHEGTFKDEHPGGIKHHHAYERIIARKRG
jgi:tellurite methyltransferase